MESSETSNESKTSATELIIKKDYRVYEKYKSVLEKNFIREESPEILVIHGTAGGAVTSGLIDWMLSGARHDYYKNSIGLFNWLIGRNGAVIEIIPAHIWTHHAHAGSQRHKKMLSVELVNPSRSNGVEYTPDQYTSLLALIDSVAKKYRIKTVQSHDSLKPSAMPDLPPCPGNFNWQIFENEMLSKNYEIKKMKEGVYEI